MNRYAIVLAAAAVLAAPVAALAGDTAADLYGVGRVSLDYTDNNNNTAGQESSTFSLSSNQSNLGVFAAEDIAAGWDVIARLEGGVSMDTGSIFDSQLRDTYVGLGTPYGTFRAGHYSSAYKLATEWMDPFRDTIADAQAVLGNLNGNVLFSEWYNNVIGWQSPVYSNGVRLNVDYIINQGNDNLPQTTAQGKQNGYSLDLRWHRDLLTTGFAFEGRDATTNAGNPGSQDITAFKFYVGTWIRRPKLRTYVTFVFENAQQVDITGTGTDNRNAIYLSATHHIYRTAYKAAIGWLDSLSGGINNGTGAVWLGVGLSRYLSKSIEFYLAFTTSLNDRNATYGLGQFQGSPSITEGNVPALPGRDVAAFTFGLRKSFGNDHRKDE